MGLDKEATRINPTAPPGFYINAVSTVGELDVAR